MEVSEDEENSFMGIVASKDDLDMEGAVHLKAELNN